MNYVKTFVEQLVARLPVDQIVSFHQVIAAVEAIFGRSVTAEHSTLMRRHLNLLATLREKGIDAVGNEHDQWAVEVPVQKEMAKATRYIEVMTMDGPLYYERQYAICPAKMSEEQIRDAVVAISSRKGWDAAYMRYQGNGVIKVDGDFNASVLSELLQLARAAQP